VTALLVFDEHGGSLVQQSAPAAIAALLAELDIEFERWPAATLPHDADLQAVLTAHAQSVARLGERHPIRSMDLVALRPDLPDLASLRQKFLREHVHDDCEMRFFAAGRGAFYLHLEDRVYAVLCCGGDFISIPAGVRHWFDMGSAPSFRCIRFFTTADGWVGQFTGDEIAARLPDFDRLQALLR